MRALLDTHAAVFLWEGRVEVFGARAQEVLASHTLLVSPISHLELAFLFEIGRLLVAPEVLIEGLAATAGVRTTRAELSDIVAHANGLRWTRDPFDRLLVATARHIEASFVTRDRNILANYEGALW